MTVKEAANLIGCTELTLRAGLRAGVFPFGAAFKTKEENIRHSYIIYPRKLKEYIGGKNEK